MPNLIVVSRNGTETIVDGTVGISLMEIIRNGGFDELMALCGGCCSCATCHVHIEPADLARLPAMSEGEDDLLGSSDNRVPGSRLSCQIRFDETLAGLRVTIAPED